MPTIPTRHWLRFRLTTMFVVVTAIACVLGYHVNKIRQRHDLIARQQTKYATLYESHYRTNQLGELPAEVKQSLSQHLIGYADENGCRAPGLLPWFGEQGVQRLMVLIEVDESDMLTPASWDEVKLARRLLSEAQIEPWCVLPIDPDGEHNSQIRKANPTLAYYILPGIKIP